MNQSDSADHNDTLTSGISAPPMPGSAMTADIASQPKVYAHFVDSQGAHVAQVAAAIAQNRPKSIVFVARGTSAHAALYGAYLAEVRLGLRASIAAPSSITLYGARHEFADCLVVGVSQSGGSPDIDQVLQAAGASGAQTLAITNNSDSALAHTAHHHIDLQAGKELAVAATKTYTSELLALLLLIEGIRGRDPQVDAFVADLPELARTVLDDPAPGQLASRYRFASQMITTGRGLGYPTARETALKLMETSYLPVLAFSGADLLHGPLAMVDSQLPILAFMGNGPGGAAMVEVAQRLSQQQADLVTIGPKGTDAAVHALATPDVEERFSPLLDVLPMQQLALSMALQRGQNPDAPRGLQKVTKTV
ncbi:MAG TPA: SIS domain-containing protein [Candidatus Stackebrandtia faecavium]|nr:SIS domain-containing protein [Candidatus Stackebrandtia faecavium]